MQTKVVPCLSERHQEGQRAVLTWPKITWWLHWWRAAHPTSVEEEYLTKLVASDKLKVRLPNTPATALVGQSQTWQGQDPAEPRRFLQESVAPRECPNWESDWPVLRSGGTD